MQSESFRWPSLDLLSRLVRAVHHDEARAMDELLAALRPSLTAFFARRLSDDVADDLAQLALIRISGAVERIDPERADAYISTVARNLLRTAYRASARDRAREGSTNADDLPTSWPGVDVGIEYAELTVAVHRACMTKLGPGLREVAVGLLHGETPAEIADALHISPVTVRTRMMRARTILRSELAPYLDDFERRPA
jgi:RNA polymerase sigma factor (sigma-70 family)